MQSFFVDDTSLFSVIHDIIISLNNPNKVLKRISKQATHWKIKFNSESTKQAQNVTVSRKFLKKPHLPLLFNNSSVTQIFPQKHLRIIFEDQLKFGKISKTLGVFQDLAALIRMYKAFIRPPLHYSDIVYDQAYNKFFHQKLKYIQYNACLAITGAIRGALKEKLYKQLGLESLQLRHWYRKLKMFYKIFKIKILYLNN